MRLSQHLHPELVAISPPVAGRDELFALFGRLLLDAGMIGSAAEVVDRLLEREAILSTAIGRGVAVPHAQIPGLGRLVMAASVHPRGIDYPALDREPVRLAFCLLGDSSTAAEHLAGLARLARLARSPTVVEELVRARSPGELIATLTRFEGE